MSAAPQSVAYRARRFVRRHRGTVAAASAVVVAIVIGAGATVWQARVAARERDKAQNRFRQVQEFSRSLLFDVHNALRPVPGATEARRLLLSRAVQFLDGLAADAGTDDALKFELAEGYRRLGAVQGDQATENLGDVAAAAVSFEKAAALVEESMRANPRAIERARMALDLYSMQTTVLGDLGQGEAAERAQQRLRSLLQALEQRGAADAATSIAIGRGYSNIGIHRAQKEDVSGARDFYGRALRVFESVPQDDPAWRATPRAYVLTLKRLGAAEMVQGALDASERHYRAALAMEEDVIRRDPGNTQWPFELSYTLSDLGLVLKQRGQVDEAIAMWTRSLALRRAAVAADPKNVRAIHALATILNRLGRLSRDTKRPTDALSLMREELRWRDTLIAIQGPSPGRLIDQGFAQLNLIGLLLDLADARDPAGRAHTDEARTRFGSVARPADMKPSGSTENDAAYHQWYDIQAKRVARR